MNSLKQEETTLERHLPIGVKSMPPSHHFQAFRDCHCAAFSFLCADCAPTHSNSDTVLRGFLDDGSVPQAYLRYQERVEDGTFREGAEIPLGEIGDGTRRSRFDQISPAHPARAELAQDAVMRDDRRNLHASLGYGIV